MSKQRRPAEQQPRAPESNRAEGGRQDLATGLGNSALQSRMGGPEHATIEAAPLDVVRDTALPVVGRAAMALQLEARGALNERLIEIIARSALPEDRKQALQERLTSDESLAVAVGDVVERVFGSDNAEVRAAVGRDLNRIEDALIDGDAVDSGWRAGDTVVALSADTREGQLSARSESLIGDLARALATSGGPAEIRAVCHDLHALLLRMDEEEDEDLGPDAPAPELG